jgi:hypothetical protein
MKMSRKILMLAILIFSSASFAAVQGAWIGWTYWKYDGSDTRCSTNLAFTETADNFIFHKGFLDCDIITMEIPERTFAKIGDQLFLDQKIVGKWNPNYFEWTERYNDRTVIHISITVDGSHMDYVEHWIQDENTPLYDLTGRLFKK